MRGFKFMKRILAGGFISLIGSIWSLTLIVIAGNNLVSGWATPPGRLFSTMQEMNIMSLFVFAVIFVIVGIVLMIVECFRKDK